MPINNPSGRIDRSRNRRSTPEYDNARNRYSAALQASIERREKRRREEEEARRRAELQAQQDAAQMARDKQQQRFGQADTAQRAYYAANAAADDFNRTKQLNRQQQKDLRRRDTLNNDFTLTRDREQARDQQDRDELQFGFNSRENEQKFGFQTMENEQQFGHQMQRDRFQHGNTLERDRIQFGYDAARAGQQQRNQLERDTLLNQFGEQEDFRQNEFQRERDNRLNMFDVNREARQQQYQQQNQYQRETAEVAARWQEQIQQARNAGMDFSEAQKQEMKELDKAFRKNVLNGPYDDGLKQQAMLEHQKKLAAIVPEEKVANPKEGLNSALIFHEPTKSWYLQGRDSKGFATYEPLGGPGDGVAEQQQMMMQQQEKERQLQQKQLEDLRKVKLDRLNQFKEILREKQTAENEMGGKLYADPMKAAQEEFSQFDEFYTREYELPPLFPPKEQQQQQPANGNPYRQQLEQMQPPSTFRPTTGPQKPVAVSSTNIDDQMRKTSESGDREAAAALQAIKMITEKNSGPPQPGTQDFNDLIQAMKYLRSKGIAIQGAQRQAPQPPSVIRPSQHMMPSW